MTKKIGKMKMRMRKDTEIRIAKILRDLYFYWSIYSVNDLQRQKHIAYKTYKLYIKPFVRCSSRHNPLWLRRQNLYLKWYYKDILENKRIKDIKLLDEREKQFIYLMFFVKW